MQEACSAYIKMLKRDEELSQTEISLAQESFKEGWLQAELEAERKKS